MNIDVSHTLTAIAPYLSGFALAGIAAVLSSPAWLSFIRGKWYLELLSKAAASVRQEPRLRT